MTKRTSRQLYSAAPLCHNDIVMYEHRTEMTIAMRMSYGARGNDYKYRRHCHRRIIMIKKYHDDGVLQWWRVCSNGTIIIIRIGRPWPPLENKEKNTSTVIMVLSRARYYRARRVLRRRRDARAGDLIDDSQCTWPVRNLKHGRHHCFGFTTLIINCCMHRRRRSRYFTRFSLGPRTAAMCRLHDSLVTSPNFLPFQRFPVVIAPPTM